MSGRRSVSPLLAVVLAAGLGPAFLVLAVDWSFGDAQYAQPALHEWFEGAGSCIALGAAALLLIRLRHEDTAAPHLLWVVAALIAMGMIDGVHGLTPFGAAFAWTRHGATLVGGLVFALVWLPAPKVVLRRNVAFATTVASSALAGGLAIWWQAEALPAPWVAGNYSLAVKGANALGGIGFFVAAAFFIRRYRTRAATEDFVLASHTVLFGTASLLFGFSHVWAADWWIWHGFRLLAYLVVLAAAYGVVVSLYRRSAAHAQELEVHVESRTAELRRANEALQAQHDRRILLESESERARVELGQLNARLRDSNRAALNLMHDAVEARDRLAQANRELLQEVEQRRRTEAENGALMLRNQALVSELGEIVYEWQPELDLWQWDGEYTRILGYSAEEIGRDRASWTSRVHNQDLERVLAGVGRAGTERRHYDLEYRFRRRDGSYAWMRDQGVPTLGADGKVERVLGVFRDISERKRVEIMQRRLAAIVDSSADAIIGKTLIGEVTSWNAAAERLFGYRADEMIGGPIARLIPPERLDEEARLLMRVGHGERVASFDTVRLHRDGRQLDIALTLSPIEDAEGRVVGVAAIARDVGEIKHAHAEIRSLNAELEQRVAQRTAELEAANKELESFAYSVSHDLRAPLRAIDGFSRILADSHGAELSAEAHEHLALIRTSAQQMGDLIRDLLAFARLNRQTLNREIVTPEVQVQECLALLHAEIDGRAVQLDVGALPACEGDAGLLKLVWLNLLSNAFKYTRRSAAPRIEVG